MHDLNGVLIGWPNRAPAAVLSGGSWVAQLPLANLTRREPWLVARSTGLAGVATQFDADLGRLRNLRAFALGNHNLSLAARWRLQLGTAQGLADVYDSAWQAVWAMTFDGDLLEWESVSFWEGAVDDPAAYQGYPYAALHVLPDWANARWLRVLIDDAANPDGYVQLGQLFAGGGFQPRWSASYGLSDQWTDPSLLTASESNYMFGDVRRRRRSVKFSTEFLSATEGAIAHELQRRQGVWGQVLWVPYPDDQQQSQRYGYIGRMRELSPLEYPLFDTRSVAFAIDEI